MTEVEARTAPEDDLEPSRTGAAQRRRIFAGFLLVVTLLIAGGLVAGWLREGPPKDSSVEAGFARDMRAHHAQAVSMAMVEYQRSTNPALRAVAYDIALGQQREIGIFDGWLLSWNVPLNSVGPPMRWMRDHGSHTSDIAAGRMPGMATPAELTALNRASGVELDRMFLTLMIRHHEAGRDMANAVLPRTQEELVTNLARRVVINQTAEIEQMQRYLTTLPPASAATPSSG